MSANAVHEFHDEVMLTRRGILVDADAAYDVGMIQDAAAAGLAVEPGDETGIADQMVGKDFQGNLLFLPLMIGQVDRSHAALAKPAQNAIRAEAARFLRNVGGRSRRRQSRVKVGAVHAFPALWVQIPAHRRSESLGNIRSVLSPPVFCNKVSPSIGLNASRRPQLRYEQKRLPVKRNGRISNPAA